MANSRKYWLICGPSGRGPINESYQCARPIVLAVVLNLLFAGSLFSQNREKISFDMKFGLIKGGEAIMTITDTTFNGRKAIHYHLEGRTTGITDKLFKVYDIYESIVDANTYLPYKAIRNVRERNYRDYQEVHFFHDKDSIHSLSSGGRKVPPGLSDILSVFFYFSRKKILGNLAGDPVEIPVLHGDDLQKIKIKLSNTQVIDTGMGKMECYVLSPEVDKGKLLMRSDGLRFFIAKSNGIPVLLEFEMLVGALRAVMSGYTINGVEQFKK